MDDSVESVHSGSVEVIPVEPSVSTVEPAIVPARNRLPLVFRAFQPSSLLDEVDKEDETALFDSLLKSEEDAFSSEAVVDNVHTCADLCSSLIRGAVSGKANRDDTLQKIRDYLQLYPSLSPILADEIQIAEYVSEALSGEEARRLTDLVAQIVAQNLVPLADARERLEQEVLQNAGLSDKGIWDTKYVRTKTKWFFKLQKFNLYREEAEGFTEVINVLNQADVASFTSITEKLLELAGTYDLDAYRIMDSILTAACLQPESMSQVLLDFREAIDFETTTLIALMGVKLKLYGQKSGKDFFKVRGLCHVACRMVQSGIATWNDIVPHVPLAKEDAEVHWKSMFDKATAEDQILHTNKRSVKEQFNNMDKIGFDGFVDFFEDNKNARIELVTAMFRFGMYDDAMRLISQMPVHYASTFQPLALEMAKVVHYVIDPLYRSIGLDSTCIPNEGSNFPSVINDQIPQQIDSFEGLCGDVEAWLMLLGSNIIYDRTLMVKWLRIARSFLKDAESWFGLETTSMDSQREKVFREILHVLEHCVLPALTRGVGSSALSELVFTVLKVMPYNIRFSLYYKLKADFYPHGHPMGIMAKAIALTNVKWFQRRINKDNLRLCGRLLAKDMYNNGLIICTYLAERIGSMDNFGLLVTDAMKSMASAFSADVMLYCILEFMTMPANNNHKHDAMTIMPWYRYAAAFTSIFAKKLPVELEPILEYVVGMLKAGQMVDLLLLKEMVHKLSGIEVSEGVTDEQLEALAGGEVLKAEGAYFSPMRNTKRSSVRLKDALLKSGQALPLCLLISHAEADILYRENQGKNLKLVGLLYDMCHDTLVQYGTFLATNLTKKEYADNFPSLAELIHTYKMPFECSIFLLRSVYWNEISSKIEEFKSQQNIPAGPLNEEHFKIVQETFSQIFDSVITSVVDLITPVMTQAPMEDISLRFYVLYWFLTLYDLYVPKDVYRQEIEKLQEIADQPDVHGDDHIQTVYKKKKEKERAQIVIARLREEMSIQQQHVQMLRNQLSDEKDRWFQFARPNKSDVVSQFLQMCVLPRSTFSTIDALYSAHFVSTLHELKTLNFSTLLCYDRMLCDITTALTSCSENEASRYGRLLHTILKTIMKWHGSKAVFDAECQNHPGFMTKFRATLAHDPSNVVDHIDYENFRHVCYKWHFKLTKAMVACLESESYVRIRNGLIVLDRFLPFYPILFYFYLAIERRVQVLMKTEKEKRPDLYSLAFGYMGRLRAQKPLLMMESEFHSKESKTGGKQENGSTSEEKTKASFAATKDAKTESVSPVKSESKTGPTSSATDSPRAVHNQDTIENKESRKKTAPSAVELPKKENVAAGSTKADKPGMVENGPVKPEVDSEDKSKKKSINGDEPTLLKMANGETTSTVSPVKKRERISPPRSAANDSKAKVKKKEENAKSDQLSSDSEKKTLLSGDATDGKKVAASRALNGIHLSPEDVPAKSEAASGRTKRARVSSTVSIVSSNHKSTTSSDIPKNEEKKHSKAEGRNEEEHGNDASTLFRPDVTTPKDSSIKKERRRVTTRFQDAPLADKAVEDERPSLPSTVLVVDKKPQSTSSTRKVHSEVPSNGAFPLPKDSPKDRDTKRKEAASKETNRVASKVVAVNDVSPPKKSPAMTSSSTRRSPRSERTKEKDKSYEVVEVSSASLSPEIEVKASRNLVSRSLEKKEWSSSSLLSSSRKVTAPTSKDNHRSRPSSAKNSPSETRESSREKADRRSEVKRSPERLAKRRRQDDSTERARPHRKSSAY